MNYSMDVKCSQCKTKYYLPEKYNFVAGYRHISNAHIAYCLSSSRLRQLLPETLISSSRVLVANIYLRFIGKVWILYLVIRYMSSPQYLERKSRVRFNNVSKVTNSSSVNKNEKSTRFITLSHHRSGVLRN